MKPLISIIVPVYNAEKYLHKCVDSLIGQTYENTEIFLVDDGSTDNSGTICDEYSKADSRIEVIHKENGGQSTARNCALDIVKGDYIGFVDSDDWIESDMYEKLFNAIIRTESQIAVCGRYNVYTDNIKKVFNNGEQDAISSKTAVRKFLIYDNLDSSPCDKLFCSDILKNIRFPSGYICEDVPFVYKALDSSQRIIHIGEPLYYYRQRNGSTSKGDFSIKTLGLTDYHREVCELAKSKYAELFNEADSFYYRGLIISATLCKMSSDRMFDKYNRQYKEEIRKNLSDILKNAYLPKMLKFNAVSIAMGIYGITDALLPKVKKIIRKTGLKRRNQNKKAAVITLVGDENYGNRLQNYAVHICMEKAGCNVQTIAFYKNKNPKSALITMLKHMAFKLLPDYVKKSKVHLFRKMVFRDFTNTYIKTRKVNSKRRGIYKKLDKQYSYFVIGSDQVWNPTFGDYTDDYYNMFLLFTKKQKKICFAPSFGVSQIPEDWKEKFTVALNEFNDLNVREHSGAKIINELTQKEAQVFIDPTLMLDAQEWRKISGSERKIAEPYILVYFLGSISAQTWKEIKAANSDKNFRIVDLMDKNDRDIYTCGPSGFINLISNAEYICTDSYHACVFSIIFDKPFHIFKRQDNTGDMFSRIDTLLKLFEYNDIISGSLVPIKINNAVKNNVLDRERLRVMKYLNNIIE